MRRVPFFTTAAEVVAELDRRIRLAIGIPLAIADHYREGRKMNETQEKKLAELNDNYGVARWSEDGDNVVVTYDDGDKALIDLDGNVSWRSAAGRSMGTEANG